MFALVDELALFFAFAYCSVPSRLLLPAGSGCLHESQLDLRMWLSWLQYWHFLNTLSRPFFGFRRCTGTHGVPGDWLLRLDRDGRDLAAGFIAIEMGIDNGRPDDDAEFVIDIGSFTLIVPFARGGFTLSISSGLFRINVVASYAGEGVDGTPGGRVLVFRSASSCNRVSASDKDMGRPL